LRKTKKHNNHKKSATASTRGVPRAYRETAGQQGGRAAAGKMDPLSPPLTTLRRLRLRHTTTTTITTGPTSCTPRGVGA
jgi:hypothetical protein